MDILRRNTDYALRLIISLAKSYEKGSVSTRTLADEQEVSYLLACKLMQRLHDAKIVESCMGPKGGFQLARTPDQISLLEVVEVIQGPMQLNRCLVGDCGCPRAVGCPVRDRIAELQDQMEKYLRGVTIGDLIEAPGPGTKQRQLNGRTK